MTNDPDVTKNLLKFSSVSPRQSHIVFPAPDNQIWSCNFVNEGNHDINVHLQLWRHIDSQGDLKGFEHGFVVSGDDTVGPWFRD